MVMHHLISRMAYEVLCNICNGHDKDVELFK